MTKAGTENEIAGIVHEVKGNVRETGRPFVGGAVISPSSNMARSRNVDGDEVRNRG